MDLYSYSDRVKANKLLREDHAFRMDVAIPWTLRYCISAVLDGRDSFYAEELKPAGDYPDRFDELAALAQQIFPFIVLKKSENCWESSGLVEIYGKLPE